MKHERRQKYLDIIHTTIMRMASTSQGIKGISVTAAFAELTLYANRSTNQNFFIVIFITTAVFWILDTYYLSQEKLFRELFKHETSKKNGIKDTDFSMDCSRYKSRVPSFYILFFSFPLSMLYVGIIAITIGFYIFLK